MAVSPLVFGNEDNNDPKVTIAKAKALAVRTNTSDAPTSTSKGKGTDAVPELAEQLNEELRQKYVKGAPNSTPSVQ